MTLRIRMNIEDGFGQVEIAGDGLPAKILFKQAAVTPCCLIYTFYIGVETIGKAWDTCLGGSSFVLIRK